jgi:hypothetical protein
MLYSVLLVLILIFTKFLIADTSFINSIQQAYSWLLGNTTAEVFRWFGIDASYQLATDTLGFSNQHISLQRNLALKFYICITIVMLPFSIKPLQAFLLTVVGIVLLFIISVMRNIGLLLVDSHTTHLVKVLSYFFQYFLIWVGLLYRIRSHETLSSFMTKYNHQFRERFQLPLYLH